jgi:hypothetical protein
VSPKQFLHSHSHLFCRHSKPSIVKEAPIYSNGALLPKQGNRVLLKLPPDGFLNPSERFIEAMKSVWNLRGKLASLPFWNTPNVTDGMNIPSGAWPPYSNGTPFFKARLPQIRRKIGAFSVRIGKAPVPQNGEFSEVIAPAFYVIL